MDAESEQIAELKARITKLYEENLALVSEEDSSNHEISRLQKLITELADALESNWPKEYPLPPLITRARKSTK